MTANPFRGTWRIVSMERWDQDYMDMEVPAYIAFEKNNLGEFQFGLVAGYGFDMLADAAWLRERAIYYWGDIDTHGFAILDQLRTLFPHVRSILMDRATLLAHGKQWGDEPQPVRRDLPRLDADERALFDDLRNNRLGHQIRLEQEKIGFGWVERVLNEINRHRNG